MAGQIHAGTRWPGSDGERAGRKAFEGISTQHRGPLSARGGGETLTGRGEPSLQEGWKDPSVPREELNPPQVFRGWGVMVQRLGSAFPWAEGAFRVHVGRRFACTTLLPSLLLLIDMLGFLEAAAFPWLTGATPLSKAWGKPRGLL